MSFVPQQFHAHVSARRTADTNAVAAIITAVGYPIRNHNQRSGREKSIVAL